MCFRLNSWLPLLLALAVAGASAVADDNVHSTGVKLDTPKSGKDKRMPKPYDEMPLSIYIPPGVKTIRGIVVNPFYEQTVRQEHWRAAVRRWDFALAGMNAFGVNNDEHAAALTRGLTQLGKQTKHPELKHAPLCFVGMSIGGGLSVRLAEAMPERTIAAGPVCLEVGPRSEPSYQVPMVTVFGERDGQQLPRLDAKLPVLREEGAQWAIAVQWGKRHDFHRANAIIMPLFDRAIAKRIPDGASPKDGPVELQDYKLSDGWLGDRGSWGSSFPTVAKSDEGFKGPSCWLPDEYMASVWRAFVTKDSPLKIKTPDGMGDGDFVLHAPGEAIEVTMAVRGDAEVKNVRLYDGDRLLGDVDAESNTATFSDPKPGVYALILVGETADGEQVVSPPNTIIVGQ